MYTFNILQSAVNAYLWIAIGVLVGAGSVLLIQGNGPDDPK